MTTSTPAPASAGASSVPAPAERRRTTYGRLWAGVPRDLLFLLPTLVVVLVGMIAVSTLFSIGTGLLAIVIGLPAVLAALFVSRWFGMLEVIRLEAAGRPAIPRPRWPRWGFGSWREFFAPFIDGHYWLALLHTMVVNATVGVITWTISFTWLTTGLGGVSYWFWNRWLPTDDRDWNFLDAVIGWAAPGARSGLSQDQAEGVFWFVAGALLLLTLPFVTRGLVLVHWWIARGMLAAFPSEALRQQVSGLASSRTAAVAAEGTALRRLERDIHDGPQQRLVRMQMDLAAADRQLAADPEAARALLAGAMQQARDALDELRAISRGFAPPILLDRGLVAALESLAVRSTVPTRVVAELPEGFELPAELERNAYFVAAEALTNVAKHSGATGAEVRVTLRRVPDGDATWLEVVVSDDGRGGAVAVPGHGIAGLQERAHGLGGTLAVSSPAGGPTVLTATFPLTSELPGSVR
ncbi:sensor histidine kinase [Naasia aerilata]|uniref:histidine kinase n=1 Tax=Naasia aerilata TaxID=1162966 RepID=A0ABN6XNB2_9MICO|nr:sensor histidine kinase [Naasia aerilata]BDZ46454.1 histidine kinase [Naasia aerilata]